MTKDKNPEESVFWQSIGTPGSIDGITSILDAIQEGIILVDNKGWVHYVNPAFTNITGVNAVGRVGKKIQEVCPGGPLSKVIESGQPVYGEKYQMKDATINTICNAAPIIVNNQMMGAVVIFQDVTKLLSLSSKLEKSEQEINLLHNKLSHITAAKYDFKNLVGNSPPFLESIQIAQRSAQTNTTILLLGESGTGKELFAHSIHNASRRNLHPFIKVNCAAVPDSLVESEFFGYEKGAFTGANGQKIGMFDLANRGTIFLDEIAEMSLTIQAKLLRILEDGEMFRIGGKEPIKVDVRIIAATNRNLKELVKEGKFRSDLFYRLNVITVEIPPLRERFEDIIPLANFFLETVNRKMRKQLIGFSKNACQTLTAYSWPGNIRELRNCVERAAIMAEGYELTEHDFQFLISKEQEYTNFNQLLPLGTLEQELVKDALNRFGNSLEGKKKAAAALNISLRTLYNKINKYMIK